ncbi:MAG TPA: LD-carboxypeptidase [Candidatus Saccharimonadales bacterium]|nr:LD-carboxypeptidase [Candidatus Saccharimonadales bacterium]
MRPLALRPGMRIGVVAPSGSTLEPSETARGVSALKQMGFEVELAAHTADIYGHLSGDDSVRSRDLLSMLERPDIDAIMCLRGGAGAMRTALALDPSRLQQLREVRPKPFIGYSDITVIHAVLARALGWVTFYGPMVISLAHPTDYTVSAFRRALMVTEAFRVEPDPDDPYVETLVPGEAEGELVGGCLTLLATLVGSPWQPDLSGRILFFEDVDEEPYAIERYLSQLLAAGLLRGCAGIVIGEHVNCAPRRPGPTLGLEQVFRDLLKPLGVPTLYHLPIGHGRHLATLPLGARARLDATQGTLTVVESGVV